MSKLKQIGMAGARLGYAFCGGTMCLSFDKIRKLFKSFGNGSHITSTTDDKNNIYIACSGDSQNSSYISKLDNDGNEIWKTNFEFQDKIYDLKVIGNKLYLAGTTFETKT